MVTVGMRARPKYSDHMGTVTGLIKDGFRITFDTKWFPDERGFMYRTRRCVHDFRMNQADSFIFGKNKADFPELEVIKSEKKPGKNKKTGGKHA